MFLYFLLLRLILEKGCFFLFYGIFPIFKIIACGVISGCKKYRPLLHEHFSTVSASEVFTARYISKLSAYLIPPMK